MNYNFSEGHDDKGLFLFWVFRQIVVTPQAPQMEAFPQIKQPSVEWQRIPVVPDLSWMEIPLEPARTMAPGMDLNHSASLVCLLT